MMQKIENKMLLGLICIVITIGLFFAGLWPLNFHPENKVKWLDNANGVSFYGRGMIYSADMLNMRLSPSQKPPFTVEIWLQPKAERSRGISRILSFYNRKQSESFFIGQWKSYLIIQNEAHKEIGIANALLKNRKIFITITSGENGADIYINGKIVRSYPDFFLIENSEMFSGQMILGNSPVGRHNWRGEIYGIAIYTGLLSSDQILQNHLSWMQNGIPSISKAEGPVALYLFNERSGASVYNHSGKQFNLLMPSEFSPLQKTVLTLPWEEFQLRRSYFKDVFINLAGFMPFGFFLSAFLLKATGLSRYYIYILTALLGGGISLAIELTQIFLPARSSSLTDLILNTLGTAVGIIIFQKVSPFLMKTLPVPLLPKL